MSAEYQFNSIPELINEIAKGHFVIVADDESRENEGDLIFAAQFSTPDKINFMMKEARGLICVPMDDQRLNELALHPMKVDLSHMHQKCDTGWAISVDAAKGVTTGISAADRSQTVKTLIDPKAERDEQTRGRINHPFQTPDLIVHGARAPEVI